MDAADIPARVSTPWATDAAPGDVRVVPVAPTGVAGAASMEQGFPHETLVPLGAGGTPPFGQDTNGILKLVTQWLQWQAAGNATLYDPTFATAIGGYPKGATLASTTAGKLWLNMVDDNLTDPDGGGAENWSLVGAVEGTPYVASNPGYVKIPGTPLILQWANFSVVTSNTTNTLAGTYWGQTPVALPIAFPNAALASWAQSLTPANGQFNFANIDQPFDSGDTVWVTSLQNGVTYHGIVFSIGW